MGASYVLLIVVCALWFTCSSAESGVAKTRKVETCAKKCDHCFMESDSLGRMGCEERCKLGDANAFTCSIEGIQEPSTPHSKKQDLLRKELNRLNAERTEFIKTRDFTGLASMYTLDALYIADTMPAGFGRNAVGEAFSNWLAGNPHIAYATYTSDAKVDNFGEDETVGKVWDNGEMRASDSEDNYLATFRYMIIYKRIDGQLLQHMDVLFKADNQCE